jgi:hypothetical protein
MGAYFGIKVPNNGKTALKKNQWWGVIEIQNFLLISN